MGKTHVLTIRNWHPARLNQWDGRHWSVRHRLKRADREMVGICARLAGIPPATVRRRVSLVLTMAPRQRRPDPDCWWKSTLDALTACGLLVDDSPKWCELGRVSYERGAGRRTVVLLEDLRTGERR
jgi:hypothetical protein